MFLLLDLMSPRTWLAVIHHLAGMVTGLAAFIVVAVGVSLGVGLAPLAFVGIPLLGITLRLAGWFAAAERARFSVSLGPGSPPGRLRRGRATGGAWCPGGGHTAIGRPGPS